MGAWLRQCGWWILKAATAYRIAKSFDKSKDCLLKAIECYKNNKSWFHAAKCYEQIFLLSKETDKLTEVEEYARKAVSLYQQHGSPEAAASALDKAAKITEQKHPELALRFYQQAVEVILIEDSTRQAAEFCSKVSRLLVKLRRYDDATIALKRNWLKSADRILWPNRSIGCRPYTRPVGPGRPGGSGEIIQGMGQLLWARGGTNIDGITASIWWWGSRVGCPNASCSIHSTHGCWIRDSIQEHSIAKGLRNKKKTDDANASNQNKEEAEEEDEDGEGLCWDVSYFIVI